MLEHPDVAEARRSGWPRGAAQENQDSPEWRAGYAEEHFSDFLSFAQAGQPDILDEFIAHFRWEYKSWLN